MKIRSQLNIALISLSMITIYGCSRDKGSEFFASVETATPEAEMTLSGGVNGGRGEIIVGESASGGAAGGAATGGAATDGAATGGAATGGAATGGAATGGAATDGAATDGAATGGAATGGAATGGAATDGAATGGASGGTDATKPKDVDPPPVDVKPPVPSDKDICDPLKEEGEEITLGYGLVGKLYDGAPNKIQHFSELLSKGKALDGAIYMSNLNIPTRKFDKGFPRENGQMVMNGMGKTLIENFGIEFTGSLELMNDDEPGYYEVGVIGDDGVILDLNKGPNPEELKNLIDGDHTTSSKFFCSKYLVRMEKGKAMPLRLRYFQGPRYHIALVMIWRKVDSLSAGNDTFIKSQLKNPIKETRCGIAGNNFFFDPESNSHPQMEYQDMMNPEKRVVPWKIVKHKNLRLPAGYSNMECVSKKP